MKRFLFVSGVVALGVAAAITMPTFSHLQEQARRASLQSNRRRALMDPPQSERALRVPTAQQLDALLPKEARQVLEQSSQWTLFSVEPREDYEGSKRTFHRHKIWGQTIIADAVQKAALLASLYDGFVPAPNGGMKFGCFNPRHGIRATLDGKTVDLLVCFSCHQFNGYLNDHQFATYEFITGAPAPTFNQVLTAANVPISR